MLGALGAHGLKGAIESGAMTAEMLDSYETGVRFHIYHSLALLLIIALAKQLKPSILRWVANCFLFGMLLFAGSIYLLATRNLLGIESWAGVLGPITPIGGLLLIGGWGLLAIGFIQRKST